VSGEDVIYLLAAWLTFDLEIEAACASEMSADFYQTRCHILQDSAVQEI
jgi:hypothetical protein